MTDNIGQREGCFKYIIGFLFIFIIAPLIMFFGIKYLNIESYVVNKDKTEVVNDSVDEEIGSIIDDTAYYSEEIIEGPENNPLSNAEANAREVVYETIKNARIQYVFSELDSDGTINVMVIYDIRDSLGVETNSVKRLRYSRNGNKFLRFE